MIRKVAVLGAGSWGTAIAGIAGRKSATGLWARRPEVAEEIRTTRVNSTYLPDHELPPLVHPTCQLAEAVSEVDAVVVAVPSHGFRRVIADVAPHVPPGVPAVSLTKGVEQKSLKRMTEILTEMLPGHPVGVMTGPNLAREIAAGFPAASVVAVTDDAAASALQELFTTDRLRVYTNPDVVGCEVAGALKNVIAIAAGIADGMGFGDNTKATLITRGLAELARLGVALGGDPLTFSGLAGMGDLVATCMSPQSRNRYVGEQLGRGRTIDEIVNEMKMVAEGVKTSTAVVELAERHGVDMPIARGVATVVHHGTPVEDLIPALMSREAKPEMHGMRGT